MSTTPTTIKAALALLTGPGSLTDPALGCLGDADLAAVNILLAHHRQQAAALTRLLASAGDMEHRLGTLAESDLFENDDDEGAGMEAMLVEADLAMAQADRNLAGKPAKAA
jgi:hypothetical protein